MNRDVLKPLNPTTRKCELKPNILYYYNSILENRSKVIDAPSVKGKFENMVP